MGSCAKKEPEKPMKDHISKLLIYSIFGLASFPLIPLHWYSWYMVAYLGFALVSWMLMGFPISRKRFWMVVGIGAFFVVAVIRYSLGEPNIGGPNLLQKWVLMVAIPFGLSLAPIQYNAAFLRRWFDYFAVFLLVAVVWWNGRILFEILTHQVQFERLMHQYSLGFIYREALGKYFDLHPTYVALLCWTAVLALLDKIRNHSGDCAKWKVLAFVLAAQATVTMARMPFAAFMVALMVLVPYRDLLKRAWKIAPFFLLGLLLALPRYNELFEESKEKNSVSIRQDIYACAVPLLQEHYLVGLGPGNVFPKLMECYGDLPDGTAMAQRLNTHNQWLDSILQAGVFGLLALLLTVLIPFVLFFRKEKLYAAFLVLVSLSFFTENILHRQMGLVWFVMVQCLFLLALLSKDHEKPQSIP